MQQQGIPWLSDHGGGRSHRLDHPFHAVVVWGTRPRDRRIQMGPAAADAFSFDNDVQPAALSQFQSRYLADDAVSLALSRPCGRAPFHGPDLRMDALRSF